MNSKLAWGLGLFALALGLGSGLGLYLSRQSASNQIVLPEPAAVTQQAEVSTPVPITNTPVVQNENAAASAPSESVPGATWETKLNDVLVAGDDSNAKAENILALFPDAPPEAKVELAHHLVNLVDDGHYAGTSALLTNTNTPPEVATVLMNDLLNRGNQLKLPTLLEVAQVEGHPLAGQAKEVLELFLQEDKGSNWDDWKIAVDNWLLVNP